jgi:hypothetical protein
MQHACFMPCFRGRANPDATTERRLFADSAGFCQNPACLTSLFVEAGGRHIHVAEMAHIVAASDQGPRANAQFTEEERGHYDNLILLCPRCHTIVDKAPDAFPDASLVEWKRAHKAQIDKAFGAIRYETRAAARAAVEPLLVENRAIWENYGPDLDYRFDPESEIADAWQRKVRTAVLPNNRKVLAIIDANRHLVSQPEQQTVELYRQHVDDFEARHIGAGEGAGARFPVEMDRLFTE